MKSAVPHSFCNARILDLDTGELAPPRTIEVGPGGRITRISAARRAGTNDFDLEGMTVLPGLFDVHVHLTPVFPFSEVDPGEKAADTVLRAAFHAQEALLAGFTTIRCVHEQNAADLHLKRAAAAGWIQAPRIVGAGRAISTTGGHGKDFVSAYADGADEFLRACRAELAAGADIIKIYITGGIADAREGFDVPQMSAEEMCAAVAATASHHTYVVAHAGSSGAIRTAIQAGIRSFEHGYLIDDETARLMAQTGSILTPTISVTTLGDWMLEQGFDADGVAGALAAHREHLASLHRAIDAGVDIASGSDVQPGLPCEGTVAGIREIELLQEAGLSSLAALQAATTVAAKLCRVDDIVGRVTEGRIADLVALPGDPSRGVEALRDIQMVAQAGCVVRDGSR
ncbi:hypothetical protein BVC93_14160 [Mycobacterium sp. MS1601]|uniref:metal-dependent hydrolase family protein n=1 Tax=Mycobacterium sp. MS1601 TaxID=1936029 RepID=UPI0009790E90|nr:amidohydrolase family protein [Mycobacterium sp. MS1601]AQA03368.1 hypothetical protein BVC93_14160 [Mycobacterium sp. MS1601]